MRTADVIVVGGGLVGAALARGMARAGAEVLLLDEGDDAFRASRGNFGLVWVQSKGDGMGEYARWSRLSSDLWPGFAAELREETGIDAGHRRPGGLELCLDEAECEAHAVSIARMHNQPGGANDRRVVDGGEVRRMEPAVGPEVVGASFCPHDGAVDPLAALRALHRSAAAAGAAFLAERRVERILPERGGFRVETAREAFSAGRVVVAAGNGTPPLAAQIGIDVPVAPERGHILVTERVRPLFRHVLGQVRQTPQGTVMLGATRESVGFDVGFNPEMARAIAARAVRKVPALEGLRVVRGWSALRIMPADGFPIYGESEAHPGAFAATCHSGVTLAAAHALRLAPKLLEPGLEEEFPAFSPRRFDVSQTVRPAQA